MSNYSDTPNPKCDYNNAVDDGFVSSFRAIQDRAYENSKSKGFWDKPRNKGEAFMLMVSELVEGFEGVRKDLMDDHLPARKMEEVELADAVIRIMDYAAGFNLDVAGAVLEKMEYNKQRPFMHGKKF